MNKLYFVCLYSSRLNSYARFLISVSEDKDIKHAEFLAKENTGPGYVTSSSDFVCYTPDGVHIEV